MSKLRDAAQAVVDWLDPVANILPNGGREALLKLQAAFAEPDGDASMPVRLTADDGLLSSAFDIPLPDGPMVMLADAQAALAARDAEIAEAVKQDQAQAVEVLLMRDAEIENLKRWQPIETAPQDGYMLVHEDGAVRGLLRINGVWHKTGYPAIISHPWGDAIVGRDALRLLPAGYRLELLDGCCDNPTHWMPIPSGPKD